MNGKIWILIGSLSAALAVTMGAFGAHGLEGWLEQTYPEDMEKRLANWKTAADYQIYHAIGQVLVGIVICVVGRTKSLDCAGWLMLFGTILFSGMLYGWVLVDSRPMVMVVPIGGLAFIFGWLCLSIGIWLVPKTSIPASISSSRIDLG